MTLTEAELRMLKDVLEYLLVIRSLDGSERRDLALSLSSKVAAELYDIENPQDSQ